MASQEFYYKRRSPVQRGSAPLPPLWAQMRLVRAIEDPEVARKILECLDLPARAPPLGSALGEPACHEGESWDEDAPWEFDQTPPDRDDTA